MWYDAWCHTLTKMIPLIQDYPSNSVYTTPTYVVWFNIVQANHSHLYWYHQLFQPVHEVLSASVRWSNLLCTRPQQKRTGKNVGGLIKRYIHPNQINEMYNCQAEQFVTDFKTIISIFHTFFRSSCILRSKEKCHSCLYGDR